MRELTANELDVISAAGDYSAWQTIAIATASGTLAMSIFRATTISAQAGLEAAIACGIPTAIAAVTLVGALELLS